MGDRVWYRDQREGDGKEFISIQRLDCKQTLGRDPRGPDGELIRCEDMAPT